MKFIPVQALVPLTLAALLVGGCTCARVRIESLVAPPRVEAEAPSADEVLSLESRLRTASPAQASGRRALDRETVDLDTAHRCDVVDPAHCLFPFPNDHFTLPDPRTPTGRQMAFDPASMPRNRLGKGIEPEVWNRLDGFSPGPLLITHVPGLDLEKSGVPRLADLGRPPDASSAIQLIDAESGERILLWAELDQQTQEPAEQNLLIRPAANLVEGRRYVVALLQLKDRDGRALEPARGFRLFRDRADEPAIETQRQRYESEIFPVLEAAGLARDELFLAWDFTVASRESLSGDLLEMRDDAFARLGGAAPKTANVCAEDDFGSVARRVWGAFEVPNYLGEKGRPGSLLHRGADGLPERNGKLTAYFSCILPHRAFERPARLALYGHGTLGSLDEVAAGDVQAMAEEHNIAFCATNWIGQAALDYLQAYQGLADASNFPALTERTHQGILNTLFLGRLMRHPQGLASLPEFQDTAGRPLIDTGDLFFDGNSQGALLGGTATALAQDWSRAVLGVGGMRYSLILRRSTSFAGNLPIPGLEKLSLKRIFDLFYAPLERPLVLALLQMPWDHVDLNGHARHLLADRYPGTSEKSVLVHVTFGDQSVPNIASETLVRTLGIPVREPIFLRREGHDLELLQGLVVQPGISTGEHGSHAVVWDTGACPSRDDNTTPKGDGNPHGEIRRDAEVRRQKAAFLQTDGVFADCNDGSEACVAFEGEIPEICSAPPEP